MKAPGFYRGFSKPNGDRSIWFDTETMPFFVNELVAYSANEIAITAGSPALFARPELPDSIRSRVSVLDTQSKIQLEVEAFFRPVMREFGMVVQDDGGIGAPADIPTELANALTPLIPGLYDFILGARHGLQIELDIPRMQSAARAVRSLSMDKDVTAHMAAFEGVLNTYRIATIPSLEYVSVASKQQEAAFRELVEDLAYRALARDARLLGIPADFERAVRLIKRGVIKVGEHPLLSRFFTTATKSILASRGLSSGIADVFDLELVAKYLADQFFPPIVSLQPAYARALAGWQQVRTPAHLVPALRPLLEEGWVEDLDAPQPTMDTFQGHSPGTTTRKPPNFRY